MSKRLWLAAMLAVGLALVALPGSAIAQPGDEAKTDEPSAEEPSAEEPSAEELAWRQEHLETEHAWDFKWKNGFRLASADGQFKLKFGGRIQADYQFVSFNAVEGLQEALDLQNGFEFRRARLFFSGEIYERVVFKAQYDFAGGDAKTKDLFVGLDFTGWRLLFGHNKEAFSLGELTSSKYIAFLERSSATTTFAPSRNSGVNALGHVGDRIAWGLGAFYDSDDFGFSTGEDNTNLTGRITYLPIYRDKGKRLLHIGLSATAKNREETIRFRARPEAHQSNRFLDTGKFEAEGALVTDLELAAVFNRFWSNRFLDTGKFEAEGALVTDLELAAVFNRFWFSGEYYNASVDSKAFDDPSFDGWYVQAGYFLTDDHRRYKTIVGAFDRQKPKKPWGRDGGSGAWEIIARWATTDLNDGEIRGREADSLSVGVNWYLNSATRMMVNYVRSEGRDGDGIDVGSADIFLLRWQVDF